MTHLRYCYLPPFCLFRRHFGFETCYCCSSLVAKTDSDIEREKSLIDQWVCLTEERNAVLVPAAGSGIPGAPADWEPPGGMEEHAPVLFLDLNGQLFDNTVRKILFQTHAISFSKS